MIVKTKSKQKCTGPQAIAGKKQEEEIAFFLRRAFKNSREVYVINDLRFQHDDEIAQIDHLIVHVGGFILIESKSIKGQVKVNEEGEWARSYNDKWFGIPSPIQQVQLQRSLLEKMLDSNVEKFLGKILGFQKGIMGRSWHTLCSISSDAIIDRASMPEHISRQLVKSEFLVNKVIEMMDIKGVVSRLLKLNDNRPFFSELEIESITNFLMSQHIQTQEIAPETTPIQAVQESSCSNQLRCKHCGESKAFTPLHGKFGYYIKCNRCEKNTAMKQECGQCHGKNTRVQKRQESYTLICQDCNSNFLLI